MYMGGMYGDKRQWITSHELQNRLDKLLMLTPTNGLDQLGAQHQDPSMKRSLQFGQKRAAEVKTSLKNLLCA